MNMFKPTVKLKEIELIMLTRHLATMIKAGIPLTEALAVLEKQTKSRVGKQVMRGVLHEVEGGAKLAKALAKYPKVFDPMYRGMIQIAEESGTLEESLAYLAVQLKKSLQLKKKIKGAMMYPSLVVSITVVIGGMIAIFVLPKLTEFFGALDVELPLSTRVLLLVADFMGKWGWLVGVTAVLIWVGVKLLIIKVEKVRYGWQKMLMKLPVVGEVMKQASYAQLMRNLGMMVQNGVPMLTAIEIVITTTELLSVKQALKLVSKEVKSGVGLGEALAKIKGGLFSPLLVQMVKVGGRTGKMDETLLYLADYYEESVDESAKTLNTVLEPALLIGVGLMVAWIALAVISPIYELTGSIR